MTLEKGEALASLEAEMQQALEVAEAERLLPCRRRATRLPQGRAASAHRLTRRARTRLMRWLL